LARPSFAPVTIDGSYVASLRPHLSIGGGYYKAADKAGSLGMDTVQIFTKN
jgi:hypothetical protein